MLLHMDSKRSPVILWIYFQFFWLFGDIMGMNLCSWPRPHSDTARTGAIYLGICLLRLGFLSLADLAYLMRFGCHLSHIRFSRAELH